MKKVLFRFLIVCIITFACFFGYFRFGAYIFIDKEQRTSVIHSIESAPPLPPRFYELYEVANPNSLNTRYTENNVRQIIDAALGERNYRVREVPSVDAAYIGSYCWGVKKIQLIYYIEDNTTQKQCLNFNAQHLDFLSKNVGVKAASQFYFEKAFDELNDREMVTLIVMMKNPSFFNPLRRPDKVKNAVDKIMKKLEE